MESLSDRTRRMVKGEFPNSTRGTTQVTFEEEGGNDFTVVSVTFRIPVVEMTDAALPPNNTLWTAIRMRIHSLMQREKRSDNET